MRRRFGSCRGRKKVQADAHLTVGRSGRQTELSSTCPLACSAQSGSTAAQATIRSSGLCSPAATACARKYERGESPSALTNVPLPWRTSRRARARVAPRGASHGSPAVGARACARMEAAYPVGTGRHGFLALAHRRSRVETFERPIAPINGSVALIESPRAGDRDSSLLPGGPRLPDEVDAFQVVHRTDPDGAWPACAVTLATASASALARAFSITASAMVVGTTSSPSSSATIRFPERGLRGVHGLTPLGDTVRLHEAQLERGADENVEHVPVALAPRHDFVSAFLNRALRRQRWADAAGRSAEPGGAMEPPCRRSATARHPAPRTAAHAAPKPESAPTMATRFCSSIDTAPSRALGRLSAIQHRRPARQSQRRPLVSWRSPR